MMSLRLALWTAAAVLVTGCSEAKHTVRRTTLDCPASEGRLTRKSVSADGRTCLYAAASGDQVSLRLLPVVSTPQAALAPIEQELQALAPPAADASRHATPDREGGVRSDHAQISAPGIHVDANGGKAQVQIGSLHVDAQDGSAVVRNAREVRLRGEALAFERRGFRASYIVARDDLPHGLAAVGYEAAGPRRGPLTVAVVQISSRDGDKIHHDVQRLVRRNGGV
jgi:hypothetical protein